MDATETISSETFRELLDTMLEAFGSCPTNQLNDVRKFSLISI